MTYNHQTYLDMLQYKRPEGSKSQRKFCQKYLEPVFGNPDKMGNYILRVGNPKISFMSHHDTVHAQAGYQKVAVYQGFAKATGSDCLGADCTTGIYIMLRMIQAGVEGLYIVHAAEEVGCKGSRYIATHTPEVVDGIDFAISFDRYGYSSVITHQCGIRTCSDAFAGSLEQAVDLGYTTDTGGVYTDSNEYTHLIPECTNVSVGYFDQHRTIEQQDLLFMDTVADAFINANFSGLIVDRSTSDLYNYSWSDSYKNYEDLAGYRDYEDLDLEQVVACNPKSVAKLLQSMGYSADGLLDDLDSIRTYNY